RFDLSINTAWHASHSQIYPELAKLRELGMVEVIGEGARNSRTYAVTAAGREELRAWMLNSEPDRSQRNETAVRWFLLALLEPAAMKWLPIQNDGVSTARASASSGCVPENSSRR